MKYPATAPHRGRPRNPIQRSLLAATAVVLIWIASAPTARSHPVGSKLVLAPSQPTVKLGQVAQLIVKNTGTKAYRYWFPGGTNGCVFPIYRISVTAPNGQHYNTFYDSPRRMCTMAMVPGRWIVIQPGRHLAFALRTQQVLYVPWRPGRRGVQTFTITPGTYRVHIQGGGINLSTTITVVR